jgi:hypothetical protein
MVLLQSLKAGDAVAVQLRLAGVQPAVRHLLERTGTIGLLSLYPACQRRWTAGPLHPRERTARCRQRRSHGGLAAVPGDRCCPDRCP